MTYQTVWNSVVPKRNCSCDMISFSTVEKAPAVFSQNLDLAELAAGTPSLASGSILDHYKQKSHCHGFMVVFTFMPVIFSRSCHFLVCPLRLDPAELPPKHCRQISRHSADMNEQVVSEHRQKLQMHHKDFPGGHEYPRQIFHVSQELPVDF